MTQAVAIQPTYFLPRVQRGQLYARLHLWPEAANDYAVALKDEGFLRFTTSMAGSTGTVAIYSSRDNAFESIVKEVSRSVDGSSRRTQVVDVARIAGGEDIMAVNQHEHCDRF